jgi:hypothetical protein
MPGLDGISCDFYRKFWNELGSLLVPVANTNIQEEKEEELPSSVLNGVMLRNRNNAPQQFTSGVNKALATSWCPRTTGAMEHMSLWLPSDSPLGPLSHDIARTARPSLTAEELLQPQYTPQQHENCSYLLEQAKTTIRRAYLATAPTVTHQTTRAYNAGCS